MKSQAVISCFLCFTLLLVHLDSSEAAPRSLISESDVITAEDVARWMLTHLSDFKRERRNKIDGGLLSRHSAVQNYLNAYEAQQEAADAFGPGKRK